MLPGRTALARTRRLARLARALASDDATYQALERTLERRVWSRQERERATVGPGTYFNGGATITRFELVPPTGLVVGAYCSFAEGVEFMLAGNHPLSWVTTSPGFPDMPRVELEAPIVVGNDVWIGKEAVVLPGARIGDGAVVAARAVVAGEVEPYAIVGGVPARRIRRRFDDATCERLQATRWWDWPREELDGISHLLMSEDVEAFLAYAERRAAP